MPRLPRLRRTYSPNQVVALNVARARALRGWTQEEAAAELAPYLGARLSTASFSAIERSIKGTRVKQFTADELVAFSRGFQLPIGWFFVPPPPAEDAGLHTPDGKLRGIDFRVLVDAVLGNRDSLPPWRKALFDYASEVAAAKGSGDKAGQPEMSADPAELSGRIDAVGGLRAAALLRESFGDLSEAHDVLLRLARMLARLDEDERADTSANEPAQTSKERRPTAPSRRRRH